jgi:RNA methyltransferase, TrmH family
MEIKSIKDEKVIEARELNSSKMRVLKRKFLILGEEAISWALVGKCKIEYIFASENSKDEPFIQRIQNIPIYFASDGILKKISDTSYLIPFIAVASFMEELPFKEEIVVCFDGVKDFGNIGTIVRTAKAFSIHEFVATDSEFDLFYKKTIDSSRGSVFTASLKRCPSGKEAIQALKEAGYQVVVTTVSDSEHQSFAKIQNKPIAVVFGNETEGVSKEVSDLADVRIQIPMSGEMESLNVAVAAGISLYEMKTKVILAMLKDKIKDSFGNILYVASRWNRLVFDKKLKSSTSFSADQAIAMMIVYSDGKIQKEKLAHDMGLIDASIEDLLKPLLSEKYLSYEGKYIILTPKGEEAIAKIWIIGELADNAVFKDFTEDEIDKFHEYLKRFCENCQKVTPFF